MEDKFQEVKVEVPFGSKRLEAALCLPTAAAPHGGVHNVAVILTHGAGVVRDMNFTHLVSLAHALACHGYICLRFTCKGPNLGYRVKAYRAAWEYLKSQDEYAISHIFLGGRSMGSRAAVALARQLNEQTEDSVRGVVCLSFPLHPPGQTHKHRQRSEDLRELRPQMPVLFVSGAQDNMCNRVLFDSMLKDMKAAAEVCWLEGGSHGLIVKGRTEESVMDEVNSRVVTWIVKHTS